MRMQHICMHMCNGVYSNCRLGRYNNNILEIFREKPSNDRSVRRTTLTYTYSIKLLLKNKNRFFVVVIYLIASDTISCVAVLCCV